MVDSDFWFDEDSQLKPAAWLLLTVPLIMVIAAVYMGYPVPGIVYGAQTVTTQTITVSGVTSTNTMVTVQNTTTMQTTTTQQMTTSGSHISVVIYVGGPFEVTVQNVAGGAVLSQTATLYGHNVEPYFPYGTFTFTDLSDGTYNVIAYRNGVLYQSWTVTVPPDVSVSGPEPLSLVRLGNAANPWVLAFILPSGFTVIFSDALPYVLSGLAIIGVYMYFKKR